MLLIAMGVYVYVWLCECVHVYVYASIFSDTLVCHDISYYSHQHCLYFMCELQEKVQDPAFERR